MRPTFKPSFIPLSEITFEIERTSDSTVYEASNIGIVLNHEDNDYYLNFCIRDLGMKDINLPLSYLKNQEESFRENQSLPHFLNQKHYSRLFRNISDNSAALFQAYNEQLRINEVFSISLYCSEKLKSSTINL